MSKPWRMRLAHLSMVVRPSTLLPLILRHPAAFSYARWLIAMGLRMARGSRLECLFSPRALPASKYAPAALDMFHGLHKLVHIHLPGHMTHVNLYSKSKSL